MEKNYLDAVHKTALSTSGKLKSECLSFAEKTVKNGVFYEPKSVKKLLFAIIEVIVALAMVIFCNPAKNYILIFLEELKLAYPVEYIGIIYFAVAIVFFGCGGFTIFKLLMSFKYKENAKKAQMLSNRLDDAIDNILPDFEGHVKEAIEKGEDIEFEPVELWQTELSELKGSFAQNQKQQKKISQILSSVCCGVSILCTSILLFPYIVEGLASGYETTSGYVVFTSYLFLNMVLSTSIMHLRSWYGKIPQYIGAGLFAIYQLITVVELNVKYSAFDSFVAAIKSKDINLIIDNCVFNSIVITMILISALTIWMLLATDFELILDARKNGKTVPMEPPAENVKLSSEKVKSMLLLKGIIATVATMLVGTWMVNIVAKGFSFGRILAFLAIAVVWTIISSMLESDVNKAVYNKFSKFLYLLHFVGYVIIVLSSTPGFGWGTIILLGIHFLSLFLIAIVFGILGSFL